MNVDRTTILSLALTMILVTSMLPMGIVGMSGTAEAQETSSWYTLRQPDAGVCYEVQPFSVNHEKMEPEVRVRGSNDVGDVQGQFEDPDWNGPVTIESIMDYRYRHYPDPDRPTHAVGQTSYYAPYLNDQYRYEGWEFGTYGLYNWSENGDSHMFFYENVNGEVSLVVRHDKMWENVSTSSHDPYNGEWPGGNDGFFEEAPGGGEVTWDISNLPTGEWAYIDDMYIREDQDDYYTDGNGVRYGHREAEYESRPLREFNGGDFNINWYWAAGESRHGTDGGAYRGFDNLASSGPVTIDPQFSNIDEWEVRTNDGTMDGEQLDLDMDSQLVIEQGANCLDGSIEADRNPVEAGEGVTFTAEAGADEYQWDFDGDGSVDETTTANSVAHVYESADDVEVSVTMVRGEQAVDATTSLDVRADESPTADFAVEDETGDPDHLVAGEQAVFNGSVSSDNVALSGAYEWDFDGTSATGEQATHSFSSAGDHEVTLTVTDRAGNADNVTKTVTVVAPDDPVASASASPTEAEAGAPITLDASESTDDHGSVVSYAWSAPGGSVDTPGQSQANVTYGSEGEYNVTLTVTDNNGNTDTAEVSVTVTEPESPDITGVDVPDEVSANEEFTASVSADDESGIASATYTFSDGTTQTVEYGESVTHSFAGPGSAWVEVTVQDRAGVTASSEPIPINVTQAPAADLRLTTNGTAPNGTQTGETVTFDASESSDVGGPIVEYQWDFDGDGGTDLTTNQSENVVTHEYDSGDTYDAAVTVVDQNGLTNTATAQIEVEGDDDDDEQAIGGGGGGGVSVGPPPVNRETEQTGPNSAAIDVRNARGDEAIQADLPATELADETGVNFQNVAVDLAGDNPHVVFETAASADRPGDAAELTATHETLAYLELDGRYLGNGVESATVEFEVERSALGGLAEPDDVVVYQYDGAWTQVNATVVEEEGDTYRLAATTDGLGTLAVGTDQPLMVADAGLETDDVATGETLTATATVENDGETAEIGTVELALGENVVAAETVEVAPGETAEVTLRGTAPATGTYEATVGGVSLGELDVLETRPADVSVADVSVNESTIEAGEQVAITATVENLGGEAGEETVNLTLFGEELDSETVRVEGGETEEVTFVRQIDATGTYTAEVGGETAEIEVTDSGSDLGDAAPDVPGFGMGAALVALLAAALLARLRS